MLRDTTVIPFRQPEAVDDPLTEVGAHRMLAQGALLPRRVTVASASGQSTDLPDCKETRDRCFSRHQRCDLSATAIAAILRK
jgi:hypothetical protein